MRIRVSGVLHKDQQTGKRLLPAGLQGLETALTVLDEVKILIDESAGAVILDSWLLIDATPCRHALSALVERFCYAIVAHVAVELRRELIELGEYIKDRQQALATYTKEALTDMQKLIKVLCEVCSYSHSHSHSYSHSRSYSYSFTHAMPTLIHTPCACR